MEKFKTNIRRKEKEEEKEKEIEDGQDFEEEEIPGIGGEEKEEEDQERYALLPPPRTVSLLPTVPPTTALPTTVPPMLPPHSMSRRGLIGQLGMAVANLLATIAGRPDVVPVAVVTDNADEFFVPKIKKIKNETK